MYALVEEIVEEITKVAKNEDKEILRKNLSKCLAPTQRVWNNNLGMVKEYIRSPLELVMDVVRDLSINEGDKEELEIELQLLLPETFGEGAVIVNHDLNLMWAHIHSINRKIATKVVESNDDEDSNESGTAGHENPHDRTNY